MRAPAEFLEEYGEYLQIPGAIPEASEAIATDLLNRYQEPWRRHHTIEHIGSMAAFLIENEDQLQRPNSLMWSVLGHDSVYIPELHSPGVNETHSKDLTSRLLSPYIGGSATLAAIEADIMSTADHKWDGDDLDRAFFLDADMSILGSDYREFLKYDSNIRSEYSSSVSFDNFNEARLGILQSFAAEERLFNTDVAQEQFGKQAKKNLERAIREYRRYKLQGI